jgi:hypothetical protein
MGYTTKESWFDYPAITPNVQMGPGAHPTSYLGVPGALSLGVDRSECKAKHLPTSSTEFKYASVYHVTRPRFS